MRMLPVIFGAATAVALLCTPCAHAGAPQPPSASRDRQEGVPIVAGTSYTLNSHVLGKAREVNVWLPPGYAKGDQHYTVLYLLDGGREQDFPHIAGLGQLGALSGTYEALIIVGVRTRERQHELTPVAKDARYLRAFPSAGGATEFRRYLVEDVKPFVEARFRTGKRSALLGESLAGLFVVDTFLNQPDAFDDYIAVSPSLWWDDRALAHAAARLLAARKVTGRRLYLTCANEGGTMRAGLDELTAAITAQPDGLQWWFVDRAATDTHATILHGAALDALRRLYALPPYDGPTPWFMIEGASPESR